MVERVRPVRSYRDLEVWQRSMELAVECHLLSRRLRRRGASGVAAQIERAAATVPANIAEGCGRRTRPDYLRHLSIANGSLLELETHVLIASRLGLLSPGQLATVLALSAETGRLLDGLIRERSATQVGAP
jgi:four helix bundle protein